jgi:hypothetical protein
MNEFISGAILQPPADPRSKSARRLKSLRGFPLKMRSDLWLFELGRTAGAPRSDQFPLHRRKITALIRACIPFRFEIAQQRTFGKPDFLQFYTKRSLRG